MAEQNSRPRATGENLPEWLAEIVAAIQDVDHGEVSIIRHQGRVVEVVKHQKIRSPRRVNPR